MTRTASLFLSILLLTGLAAAQSATLPDSPSAARQNQEIARVDSDAEPAAALVTADRPKRTADAKYWSLLAFSAVAMVADVETTVRSLKNPRCREANPFLGDNPTRGTMYAMKGGVGALTGMLSYFAKKKGWNKWWLIPTITGGAHGAVAIHNWRTGCF